MRGEGIDRPRQKGVGTATEGGRSSEWWDFFLFHPLSLFRAAEEKLSAERRGISVAALSNP